MLHYTPSLAMVRWLGRCQVAVCTYPRTDLTAPIQAESAGSLCYLAFLAFAMLGTPPDNPTAFEL
jgi:hypothetical protein